MSLDKFDFMKLYYYCSFWNDFLLHLNSVGSTFHSYQLIDRH
jgi:hypothetical protein